MNDTFAKNYDREQYSFANINLLGRCNVNCYFCLGKDIPEQLSQHNQIATHFDCWRNFYDFLDRCHRENVTKIYVTGQNVDSLQYWYLSELIDALHENGFQVGLRTNGYLAHARMGIINRCDLSVGYSIHTLDPETNYKIMNRRGLPDWDTILRLTKNPRVSIVINRYNVHQFFDILAFLSQYKNIRYVQARRVSTDTRAELLEQDARVYEGLYEAVNWMATPEQTLWGDAEVFRLHGLPVCFWRTVKTSINSLNYFTDGTISDEYFVVAGYLKNCKQSQGPCGDAFTESADIGRPALCDFVEET